MKNQTTRPRRTHPRPARHQPDALLRARIIERRLHTDFLALAFYPGMPLVRKLSA